MSIGQPDKKEAIRPAGFTLVELLVVISIISLLMSILLPSLSGAREMGKRVHCMANMRSLTHAWMMYAYDNDDNLCSANTDWELDTTNTKGYWVVDGDFIPTNTVGGTKQAIEQGALWSYIGKEIEAYKCKSDSSDLLRSYSICEAMNGCDCEKHGIVSFKTWSGITGSSTKSVFIDAESRLEWIEGPFCSVRTIYELPPRWYQRDDRNITARHSGGTNMSFADGHCENWKYSDPRTVDLAYWQIEPENASPENPDIEKYVQLLWGKSTVDVDAP